MQRNPKLLRNLIVGLSLHAACVAMAVVTPPVTAADLNPNLIPLSFDGQGKVLSGGQADVLCGPRSVIGAASRLGIPLSLDAYARRCRPGAHGVSLLDLRDAALGILLYAQGARLSWEQLTALDTPAVLYLSPSHFAFVDPREKPPQDVADSIRLYDYPKSARWITRQELERNWHGEALIIRDKIPRPKVLQFDTLLDDYGEVPPQGTVTRTVRFKNADTRPVTIRGIESSCGCTVGKLNQTVLQPGENGELTVTIKLSGRRGVQRQEVKVASDDPLHPQVTLTFQGIVVSPIHVSTDLIDWGPVMPGQKVRASFVVTDRAGGYLQIKSAGIKLPDAGQARDDAGVMVSCKPAAQSADAIQAALQRKHFAFMDRGAGDAHFEVGIAARIPDQSRPGPKVGELLLVTNDRFFPEFRLPVVYSVVPSGLAASPGRLRFGVLDGQGAPLQAQQLVIRRLDGLALGSPSFSLTCNGREGASGGLRASVAQVSGDSATVDLVLDGGRLKPLLHQGLNRGEIQVSAGNQRIAIPWSCYVRQ